MNKKPIRIVVFFALIVIIIGLLCIIWNDKLISLSKSTNNDDTGRFSEAIVNYANGKKKAFRDATVSSYGNERSTANNRVEIQKEKTIVILPNDTEIELTK